MTLRLNERGKKASRTEKVERAGGVRDAKS